MLHSLCVNFVSLFLSPKIVSNEYKMKLSGDDKGELEENYKEIDITEYIRYYGIPSRILRR